MSRFAPIVVFAYKRPEHTARLLASLAANPEARESQVLVYSDGPRSDRDVPLVNAVRAVVKGVDFPRLELIERDRNWGLARNVIDGVTRACESDGRVIVLEDDLIVSTTFIDYMNRALDRYRDDPRVFHVSGYMYPVDLRMDPGVVFLPFISSYGWGTWSRAWQSFDSAATAYDELSRDPAARRRFDLDGNYRFYAMLEAYRRGEVDSWAIRWYLSVFARGGLAVFPARSLVENRGFGEDATHHGGERSRQFAATAAPFRPTALPQAVLDVEAYGRIKRFLGWELSLPARLARRSRRLIRRILGR